MRALVRFFRSPPLALRIVLGCALALELTGLSVGLSFVPHVAADALRSGVAGMLPWLLVPLAAHALLAALAAGALLSVRRAPLASLILASGPLGLAVYQVSVGSFGFSTRTGSGVSPETLHALVIGIALHGLSATVACAIAVIAIPFAAIRGSGAEGVRPMSNGESS
jgi:hypothetical protein